MDRFAAGLLELGITSGDVVSFQVPNWIEWVVIHLGVSRIGAISNPLIPIYRGREVGFMVGQVIERLAQTILYLTDDKVEGTDAFLEKRPAQFRGR